MVVLYLDNVMTTWSSQQCWSPPGSFLLLLTIDSPKKKKKKFNGSMDSRKQSSQSAQSQGAQPMALLKGGKK